VTWDKKLAQIRAPKVLWNVQQSNFMGNLSKFFKEPNTSLVGTFYPKHYIIATFSKYSAAKDAYQSLRNAGFSEDEVIAATGEEVLAFFKHFREDAGLWGIVMRPLSRLLFTEATFADHDIDDANGGSGFVAVHSLTDQETKKIAEIMTPFAPSSIEWYLAGGIRSLV
jgi:hypothetical protein